MKNLRTTIRSIIKEMMSQEGDPIDTFEKVESLVAGDQITKNGQPITVVDVDTFTATLTFTKVGKSTLQDLDYRLAVRYDEDPSDLVPEIQLRYIGAGDLPNSLRQPARQKGPGKSYSIQD